MNVPVPQDVEQIIGVPVGIRQQVFLHGCWVTVLVDVAEYIRKLIASVALLERKVDPAIDTSSWGVSSGRETRDVADVVQDYKDQLSSGSARIERVQALISGTQEKQHG